ncbi:uncharacterized protein METZ01_LOCUS219071, partial [marine metagenome]
VIEYQGKGYPTGDRLLGTAQQSTAARTTVRDDQKGRHAALIL